MRREALYAVSALVFVVMGYSAGHEPLTAIGWLMAGATVQSVATRLCGGGESG